MWTLPTLGLIAKKIQQGVRGKTDGFLVRHMVCWVPKAVGFKVRLQPAVVDTNN